MDYQMTPNPDMGRHGIWEKCSEMTHSFHCFNFGTTTEILTDVSSNIPKNPISSEITNCTVSTSESGRGQLEF